MSDKLLETLLSEEWYGQRLIDALKEKGWTPPPEKPEFKPGDYVEVREYLEDKWLLRRFHHESNKRFYTDSSNSWTNCRHAPTWIRWGEGEEPDLAPDGQVLGYVYTDIHGKAFLSMNDGRWAWMPED